MQSLFAEGSFAHGLGRSKMNIDQLKQIADGATEGDEDKIMLFLNTFGQPRVNAMLDVIEAVDTYRNRAMQAGIWYTGMGCEHAENVDDSLKALEEIE